MALVIGLVATVDFFVISAIWNVVGNMWIAPGYVSCNASHVPLLPRVDPECAYSSPITLLSYPAVLLAIALVIWSWWLAARWALPPLRATAETVRRLGPQNLGQRIQLTGGQDAMKDLADALDDALHRLAAGYDSQRRFAANASHELRTPLAVQRVLTEVAMENPEASDDLRRLGVQLLRTNERNENLIEGLLVLSESDRGLQGKVPVALEELAGSVLETYTERAKEHDVSLRRQLSGRTVPGDPVLLERLIANLVVNGILYNVPGGWVETTVAVAPAITVSNSGPQVPAEAVSTLFEPFRRLGAERVNHAGGVGLGLSIVRSIVTAHDGTISAQARPEGGLTIAINLPADR